MKNPYSIGCLTCKISIWIGQDSIIYQTAETRRNLENFLLKHKGHPLKFDKSETIEKVDGCQDITPDFKG